MSIIDKVPVVTGSGTDKNARYLNVRFTEAEFERIKEAGESKGYRSSSTNRHGNGVGSFIRAVVLAALDEAGE